MGKPFQGFPKSARLRKRSEFERIYREGCRVEHAGVVVFFAPSHVGEALPSRFGITVTRRQARKAVDRNRLRRLWREAIRRNREKFQPGLDIVLNIQHTWDRGLGIKRVEGILLEVCAKAGLLR